MWNWSLGFGLERVAWIALARPKLTAVAILCLVAASVFGLTQVKFDEDLRAVFAGENDTYRDYVRITEEFVDPENENLLLVEGADLGSPENFAAPAGTPVRASVHRGRRQRLLAVCAPPSAGRQWRRVACRRRCEPGPDACNRGRDPLPPAAWREASGARRDGDDLRGHADRAEGAARDRPGAQGRDGEDGGRRSSRAPISPRRSPAFPQCAPASSTFSSATSSG